MMRKASSAQKDLIEADNEAEQLLKNHFAQNSHNFLEQNHKIFKKKVERIQAKYSEGHDVLAQAENEVMMEIYRMNQELAKIRAKKLELDRTKEAAIKEAKNLREQSAKEFLAKQEQEIKNAIDKQINERGT
jgi:gamma-glutamylcyclotransferase (GGCT)/AIG2-like uncharacterized protein YtfP